MVIDERKAAATAETAASAAAGPAVFTWPATEDELDAMQRELESGAPATAESMIPAAVREWPDWLQRQWLSDRRQRARRSHPQTLASRLFSPAALLVATALILTAFGAFGIGAAMNSGSPSVSPSSSSSSSNASGMGGMGASNSSNPASTANVPDATQQYGNQPAKFVMDPGGVKHFTLTAEQVMWQPVKGQKVVAWTLDGTVPGPMIQATAGDHVRITIVNHLPEATAIHWHGLEVPTDNDGVPPIGMKPIEPGQSYTYDFTLQDADAGTHWYHSHYDDLTQVGGGMYGAFIVAARPGSPEYAPMLAAEKADVDQTIFIGTLGGYFVMNGKSFPDTQPIAVKHGQTVHLRLIGADTSMIHPMHLHGHSFQIVAEDGHLLPAPITKDTVDVSPGETFDLTFYAWAAPGSVYPFHCHILTHLMNPGQKAGEMGGLITLIEYQK